MNSSFSVAKRFALGLFLLGFFFNLAPLHADAVSQALEKVTLPNNDWTWAKPEKDANSSRIMYPKKTGQAVNLRIHSYEVPVSAKSFLEQVRTNIISKPDYQGAEVRLLINKTVDGTSWDVFEIKRKDEISQEIWGRKPNNNIVMMIIYTGAGSYFQEYYPQFTSFMTSISK